MKKFTIFFISFVLFTSNIYPQLSGANLIYNSNQFGLLKFQSIKKTNSEKKDIYIQLGVNFINTQNESGRYLKLNKNNTSWFIPANGFIGAGWGMEYPYGSLQCCPVSLFAISPRDTNLLIKFQITPAASCPDAKSYYTKNGGVNYDFAPFSCGGAIILPNGSDYNPKKDSTLIFGYNNYSIRGIFISKNAGTDWQNLCDIDNLRKVDNSYSFGYGYGFLKYNPFDTAYVYANGYNNVLISTNGGYNFTASNVRWLRDIVFSYKDSIMYGFNDYKLYRSTNKGISWDSILTIVKFTSLEINPDFPNILYGRDTLGIYRSTNYGLNWTLYNNTFTPSKIIIGVSKDAGSADTFYVATKYSVYKVWASFLVNEANNNTTLPDKYSLSQNYPNPFNPNTNIKYQITNNLPRQVTVKIFDILGKEIATLVNEKQSPGTYEVNWDGSAYPSGVYFYKLTAGDFTETKKMILIK
jgi:hypothetical protein